MSNKTQLQTNNTALDTLIARVNAAKDTAASLPDAGSGGSGGGSAETCTITLIGEGPSRDSIFYYSDGSNLKQANIPDMMSANVILTNVVKNSMVAIVGTFGGHSGNCEKITMPSTTIGMFFVTGDASFYGS